MSCRDLWLSICSPETARDRALRKLGAYPALNFIGVPQEHPCTTRVRARSFHFTRRGQTQNSTSSVSKWVRVRNKLTTSNALASDISRQSNASNILTAYGTFRLAKMPISPYACTRLVSCCPTYRVVLLDRPGPPSDHRTNQDTLLLKTVNPSPVSSLGNISVFPSGAFGASDLASMFSKRTSESAPAQPTALQTSGHSAPMKSLKKVNSNHLACSSPRQTPISSI